MFAASSAAESTTLKLMNESIIHARNDIRWFQNKKCIIHQCRRPKIRKKQSILFSYIMLMCFLQGSLENLSQRTRTAAAFSTATRWRSIGFSIVPWNIDISIFFCYSNLHILRFKENTWKYFTRIFSLLRSPSNSRSGSFLFNMITLGERRLIDMLLYTNS